MSSSVRSVSAPVRADCHLSIEVGHPWPARSHQRSTRRGDGSGVIHHFHCCSSGAPRALEYWTESSYSFSPLRPSRVQAHYKDVRAPETDTGLAPVHVSVLAPRCLACSQALLCYTHVSQPGHWKHALAKPRQAPLQLPIYPALPTLTPIPYPCPPPPLLIRHPCPLPRHCP